MEIPAAGQTTEGVEQWGLVDDVTDLVAPPLPPARKYGI